MKKIIKLFLIISVMFICVRNVTAKATLLTCEYYKAYNELQAGKARQQAWVLCDIYNDYSHQCYLTLGGDSASRDGNKEKIQNWGVKRVISWSAKDYVKDNNKCPSYLSLKIESGLNGYEIFAAASREDLQNINNGLRGTRYEAILTDGSAVGDNEKEKAKKQIEEYIEMINGFINSYSVEKCAKPEKVITRYEDCKTQVKTMKSNVSTWDNNVKNYKNRGYFTEQDEVIKKYNEARNNLDEFLKNKEKELTEKQKEIDDELGGGGTTEPVKPPVWETADISADSIFCGRFGEFLQKILDIMRFLVPLIIIGLSVVDFIKALAGQKQDEIKQAANKFIKRLIIGVAIFLIPTIIDLVLGIFGIEMGSCVR